MLSSFFWSTQHKRPDYWQLCPLFPGPPCDIQLVWNFPDILQVTSLPSFCYHRPWSFHLLPVSFSLLPQLISLLPLNRLPSTPCQALQPGDSSLRDVLPPELASPHVHSSASAENPSEALIVLGMNLKPLTFSRLPVHSF